MNYAGLSPEELIVACVEPGNETAWVEFVQRFHPLIARVVLRVARQWDEVSPQVIDDLVQETYLKLCVDGLHALKNFKSAHRDAIYGYIKVFTANLVHDHFKFTHSQKRGGGTKTASIDTQESDRLTRSVTSTTDMLERRVLIQQIDACVRTVASGPELERDRKIFWLYYRAGLTASAIAALPMIGLSTKGVESTLLRLTRQVRARLVTSKQENPQQKNLKEGIRPTESL
jgi:RNA polymerase sigma-70 factor (ECF subfamily)